MDVQVGVKHAVAVRFLFRVFPRRGRPRLARADQRQARVPVRPKALAVTDQRLARVPGPILSRRRGAAGTFAAGVLRHRRSVVNTGASPHPALVMGKNA